MKQALNITLGMGMLWLSAGYAEAQQVELLKPKELGRWNIPPGNYSGITPIGDGCYAVVSDKEAQDGFFVFRIRQDERTGQVTEVVNEGFRGTDSALKSGRDEEGVAFVPEDSLVWISGEADQRIVAYRMDGAPVHRELAVPPALGRSAITPNYGFEALGYDRASELFWTVTENALKADGRVVNPVQDMAFAFVCRVSGVMGCRARRMLIRWTCPNRKPKENSMLSGWSRSGRRKADACG